nr:60S acidic ribosomal protein P0-like [Arachis hypogaea]
MVNGNAFMRVAVEERFGHTFFATLRKRGEKGQWLRFVGALVRVGLVAPIDVVVLPDNTGLDPSQTSFFQVLNIPTKINKGTVEIITRVELIKKGDKVGSSEAALLSKLSIRPFSYGLIVLSMTIVQYLALRFLISLTTTLLRSSSLESQW